MCNRTPLSQTARTRGLGWRTAHASSIDEKGLIYIFKATSAPPRAGTTGICSIMKILPANSEGCWLFIFVIFLSFGFAFFCHSCFVVSFFCYFLSFVKSFFVIC